MRTRIFRRFLWSAFVLLVTTLLLIDFYVTRYVGGEQVASLRRQLEGEARILAAEPVTDPASWVRTAAGRAGARVTLLGSGRAILADSDGDMGDPESLSQPGRTAVTVPKGHDKLVLSAPLAAIYGSVADLRWRLLGVSLLSAIIALGIAYLFMHSFAKRITRLRTYIEALPDTVLAEDDLPGGNDELGMLARSLSRTAPYIRDLVDRLKLEGARREAILGSMVEGVLAVDKERHVIFCNNSFALAAGARAPVRAGSPMLDLVRDPGLLEIVDAVLATGKQINRRLQLRTSQEHSFEVQAAPLAGPTAHGALAILHDITAIERLERIRKDFVANVSHELRTPLASIRGYAETLLDGALEDHDHNRQFVEIILSQATRLNNISADLLVLSELESTGVALQPQPISIRSCIEAALRTVESTARVHGVKLITGTIEDYQVIGFEIRLEQALVNLLDNAVKFNRPNGEVRIETGAVENGKAAITIADNGVGIPSGDLPRIFERFYRVDRARSRAVGGTGLGLSIVKHVIEQIGGEIKVQSQLGKGTCFTILIPCNPGRSGTVGLGVKQQ